MRKTIITSPDGATTKRGAGALSEARLPAGKGQTEADIQNRIRAALSAYGIVLRLNVGEFVTQDGRYITSGLPKGTPDLLFIGLRRVAFIEVKRPGGRVSEAQINFISSVRRLGHRAGVAHSVEDALEIVTGPDPRPVRAP